MNNKKMFGSVLSVLMLLFAAAWSVGDLIDILLGASGSVGICAVLLIEMGILWYLHFIRKGAITIKAAAGSVFLILLCIVLLVGVGSAGSYLIAAINGNHLGTSFPWYTGFVFGFMIASPILIITGITWMILHLRERKRNVRDIRLLMQLLLIGTAVWAVIWTALRIRHILVYPDSYGHPWYATFAYTMLYFGIWLVLELAAVWLLRRQEKKLTLEELNEPAPVPPARQASASLHWPAIIGDGALILVSLAVTVVGMCCLLDTRYLVDNTVQVICVALSICLSVGISGWLLRRNYGTAGLRGLQSAMIVLLCMTVAGAAIWIFWYQNNRLADPSNLPDHWVYTLAFEFWGPILLGEGISLALLCRILHRAKYNGAEHRPGALLIVLLSCILLLESGLIWTQFSGLEYRNEVDVTVQNISYPTPYTENHILLTVEADHHVAWIRDTLEQKRGDSLYLTCTTSWNPLREIGKRTVEWNLCPDSDVRYLYVYRPGIGYELTLIKNTETGKWEFRQ